MTCPSAWSGSPALQTAPTSAVSGGQGCSGSRIWFEISHFELAATVKMVGELEALDLWVPEGRVWKAQAPDVRFPTFTRPIPRRRPPPQPAGLNTSSPEAQYRWEHDEFKYLPYTYESKFLLHDAEDRSYKLPAISREILMGFPRGHTLRLDRELLKKTPLVASEDARQAALGNSFHTGTLASLLGAVLFHKGFLAQKPKRFAGLPHSRGEVLRPRSARVSGRYVRYRWLS